jgi:arsenical pump membrane protein
LPEGKEPLILAALIGGDLGPRLLPIGSLAGLLWLDSLRRQGVYISASRFILVGLPVTIPSLGLSLLMLFFTM